MLATIKAYQAMDINLTGLTFGPKGPSRTAQTAVPQTMQLLHLQFCRSL